MMGALLALMMVMLVPLFVGTWRVSLLGLSAQGFLMTWIAFRHGFHADAASIVELVDLLVVRAIVGPLVIHRELSRQKATPRNDLIAPNLLSWAVALGLLLVAFRFADAVVPIEGEAQTLVAVAVAALLVGLLVLSTRPSTFSQVIGVLRIEDAIALFELGDERAHVPLAIRAAQTAVLLASIFFFRWYLAHAGDVPATSHEQETAPL